MNRAISNRCQALIVSHDYECLTELISQVEEQLVQLFLVLSVERSRWLISQDYTFCFCCVIAVYAFLSTLKPNYDYARLSYLMIAALFLIMALRYLCKSVVKIIDFVTPWDGDFLRLDFLIYIFGYGIYLFIYLYFIYVLYRYMIQIKGNSGEEKANVEIKENENVINNNENKEL